MNLNNKILGIGVGGAALVLALVIVPTTTTVYGQGPPYMSEQDRAWQESSEIFSEAIEDLRESGEFNEEADIGAPAFDEGTAPEEEEAEEEQAEETAVVVEEEEEGIRLYGNGTGVISNGTYRVTFNWTQTSGAPIFVLTDAITFQNGTVLLSFAAAAARE